MAAGCSRLGGDRRSLSQAKRQRRPTAASRTSALANAGVGGTRVCNSYSAAHTLSQNVTTVGLARLARACHEMNVIWRQPDLSSVGIGGGVGGYSPGLPGGTAAAASTAGSTLRTAH